MDGKNLMSQKQSFSIQINLTSYLNHTESFNEWAR